MRRPHLRLAVLFFAAAVGAAAAAGNGCSATPEVRNFGGGGSGGGGTTGAGGLSGVTSTSHTATTSGVGGVVFVPDSGPDDAPSDVFQNPCGSKCGPKELCDPPHLGLDDNCNGNVDETCTCNSGEVHFCFKGDPSYLHAPGCFPGVETCTETGIWGPCIGGVHATDNCFANQPSCHAISAPPFVTVHLATGTGSFSLNAVTEVWSVMCPAGVSPCPGVNPPDAFQALQSGEYAVTYTKSLEDGGMASCNYPLFIGATGLRAELQWEHPLVDGGGITGIDLDLHMHQPMDTNPWATQQGETNECLWANCAEDSFDPVVSPDSPTWFAGPPAMPPTPVNWDMNAVQQDNTCYYVPRGVGVLWQMLGMGCHNPRLDIDDIQCDPTILNVNDPSFCVPENINVDYPPAKQWIRIGVHDYDSHGMTYDVHPLVSVYGDGALIASLGNNGYYVPTQPVTFTPEDGANPTQGENRFWIVADVTYTTDSCGDKEWVVQPIYSDPANKTPFLTFEGAVTQMFAPGYPPLPP
jgi:hypothetical protein